MSLNRLCRWIAPFALTAALALAPMTAQAQAPDPAAAEQEGRPFDGYMLTSILAFGALFVVAKSARRS